MLSLLGGLIGILLGLLFGYVGSTYMQVPFSPPWTITLIAFVFSAFIGIVFRLFPGAARGEARSDRGAQARVRARPAANRRRRPRWLSGD